MKKLLFLLPILILGISASVWQHYQNEPILSDTALANIEALAGNGDTENTSECDNTTTGKCWSLQEIYLPHGYRTLGCIFTNKDKDECSGYPYIDPTIGTIK